MATNEKLIEVLNGLIEINNDRVNGYEKAIEETKDQDADLVDIFRNNADNSSRYASQLSNIVTNLGGAPADGTTNSGKLYRVWMDVKTIFTGHDRLSILELCEYGEDAAQKAYRVALTSEADMDANTRKIITEQQSRLNASHYIIKNYRDSQKEVHS
jgi:uncharacterized protein (TIGR02284 family)